LNLLVQKRFELSCNSRQIFKRHKMQG
jgi:hypothetical protein